MGLLEALRLHEDTSGGVKSQSPHRTLMSKLAQAIAKMEGYGIPSALPTRDNNPGDLRHSPHSSHEGEGSNDIGIIDTAADGWADLEHQLQLYAQRGMTVSQAIYEFAPPNENNTAEYLAFVCSAVGCDPSTPVAEALAL
jgi:hypothetical protein